MQVSSNVSGEMAISVPLGQEPAFPELFDIFDHQLLALGMQTYSLSMSTLEEVFLRLAEKEKEATDKEKEMRNTSQAWLGHVSGHADAQVGHADAQVLARNGDAPFWATSAATTVAVPIEGGGGGGVAAGDVWAELESFECKKNGFRQVLAVLRAVFTAARRHPITFFLIIFNPVLFMIILSLVFPLVQAKPPVAEHMDASCRCSDGSVLDSCCKLQRQWILVAIQPSAGLTDVISDDLKKNTLRVLGKALQDKVRMYKDAESLAAAMLSASRGNRTEWGGNDPPSVSALFEIHPLSGSGTLTLGYNKEQLGSARVVLSEILNATARLSSESLKSTAFADGLGCKYLFWRSPLYSNGIGAGALSLIFSQAFNLLAIMYSMDMVRMRVSRVKDMMLLSGLPRVFFWLANFLAHWFLYWLAFGISCAILRGFGGSKGIQANSFLAYVMLHLLFSPCCIMTGYVLSFWFAKEETAQVMTQQCVSLPFLIPWIIMAFVVREKNLLAENLLSLIPAYALYRGTSLLETAALNDAPLSASDVFVWDKEFAQVEAHPTYQQARPLYVEAHPLYRDHARMLSIKLIRSLRRCC